MGLDMYLNVERRIDPTSDRGLNVLAEAGITVPELVRRKGLDPMTEVDAGPLYLPMWSYMERDGGEQARKVEQARRVLTTAGLLPAFEHDEANSGELDVDDDGQLVVSMTAIYWRKVNSVHRWFVEQAQYGIDECQPSDPIEGELLAKLRADCLAALQAYADGDHDVAELTMAPMAGCFFGNYDIDNYWAEDLKITVSEVERALRAAVAVAPEGPVTFRYQSSW
jgi:hypothetical protein